ncbi:hypothetical protein [Paraburkholderia sp. J67]|uniref:hypothetical protein n=1 Tax=Paraburkholderia sp. J67 TaxID=2805435 RepID=UPI002ABDAF60|nr:hypothetical protein [Paraburkholderia sp. J67]
MDVCEKSITHFRGLWENSMLLALRDLQWHKAMEMKHPAPQGLAVFEGNAESALGDAILSVEDRLFLFEFKSTAAEGGTEFEKALARVMKKVGESTDGTAKSHFENDSRAGHHFAFSASERKQENEKWTLPVKVTTIKTTPYVTAVQSMENASYRLSDSGPDIVSLLYSGGAEYGLSLSQMAHYLEYLVENYQNAVIEIETEGKSGGGEGSESGGKLVSVPFKGLFALGNEKFIWPCADMTDIAHISALLQEFLQTNPEFNNVSAKKYPKLSWKIPEKSTSNNVKMKS